MTSVYPASNGKQAVARPQSFHSVICPECTKTTITVNKQYRAGQ